MKKVLLTAGLLASLVSSAIASSEVLVVDNSLEKNQSIGINIAPVIANFKGSVGSGVELGIGYKNYTINYTKLNGDFEKKEINIDTPFNVFIKNLSIKNNDLDKTNTFVGVKYVYYLPKDEDIDKSSDELSYFKFKIGMSINNDNPYYIGLSYNCIKKVNNKLYGYSQAGVDKYEFGTEFYAKVGVSYDF